MRETGEFDKMGHIPEPLLQSVVSKFLDSIDYIRFFYFWRAAAQRNQETFMEDDIVWKVVEKLLDYETRCFFCFKCCGQTFCVLRIETNSDKDRPCSEFHVQKLFIADETQINTFRLHHL